MKTEKTNAIRLLDKAKVKYTIHTYENDGTAVDGVSVAHKCNLDPKYVYKTLVTRSTSKNYYVFVIPVEKELNLKLAASLVNEKSIDMIHVSEIKTLTGYVRGGCSPLGMKKTFKTFLDESASEFENIMFSGGKIGLQIEINPSELLALIHGEYAKLYKD